MFDESELFDTFVSSELYTRANETEYVFEYD